MKKIPQIIYTELIPPSLITLLVLTFVVFTREFGRLAEMLIRKSSDVTTILQIILSLLPSILIFTVPFSFLIGTLIAFNRLNSDSEIIAMRANGISTYQMLTPVLKAGVLVSTITFILTLFLLPLGNWSLYQIRHQVGLRPAQSEIAPRVFNEDFPGVILYVNDIELRSSTWQGVLLADSEGLSEKRIILSQKAYPVFGQDNRKVQLHFENGLVYTVTPKSPEKDSLATFHTLDIPISSAQFGPPTIRPKRSKEKSIFELINDLKTPKTNESNHSLVELNRRIALPLSVLLFSILGVTMTGRTPRGSKGKGFLLGIGIALVYYLLFATGTELAENGDFSIGWGTWGSNLLLLLAAALSFSYYHSGFPFLRTLKSYLNFPQGFKLIKHLRYNKLTTSLNSMLRNLHDKYFSISRIRLQFLQIIDRYVNRVFLLYFGLTLTICVSLVYLFTFFELVDDILENDISYTVLLNYYFYLLPHVLMLIIPISILIATLLTFGSLEQTNQIIAFKACGISIYRLIVPVLIITLAISSLIFVLQEHILPYANQRQDNLRDIIQGRPAQTHYQVGHNWIFGQDNRLYNYNYYDSNRSVFAEISVYELDIAQNQLLGHTYAQRAEWNPHTRGWILHNGWSRTLQPGNNPQFSTFKQENFFFPETPLYFQKEVKDSNKMTYGDLKKYILSLQQGGFEVDQLKTELNKKISFPMVNIIMAILGIPFAFSLGRKGTFHGIGIGVLLGIIYWGTFGIFGVLGSNGMLAPVMAAWGPNLLFATGGLLLASKIRS